jgi:hypothetical protein
MFFSIYDAEDLDRAWQQIARMKPPFEIESRKHRANGAHGGQIGLYKVWIKLIATETGSNFGTMDRFFRRKYLPVAFTEAFGERVERLTTCEDLSRAEMHVFMVNVQADAAEYSITLPEGRQTGGHHGTRKAKDRDS